MTHLKVGAARRVTTPALGTYLAGYGGRWHGCTSVRDDLSATAVVVGDGATRLAIVAVDLLSIHEAVTARIRDDVERRTGIPGGHVLLACSHSHCSPVGSVLPSSPARQKAYVERLVAGVVEAVVEAHEVARPAVARWGRGEARIAVNRRQKGEDGRVVIGTDPGGHLDPTVAVLRLEDENGVALATLVNHACHPTILGPRHYAVSAAWPGVMRRVAERELGGLVLFLQGATGDINPAHSWAVARRRRDAAALERLGQQVGDVVVAVSRSGLKATAPTPIRAHREEVWLALTPKASRKDGRPLEYREALRELLPVVPGWAIDRLLDRRYPWRNRAARGDDGVWRVPMEVQTLRIGDTAVVGHASETFSALGGHIRAESPAAHTMVTAYANGMIGYLPTAEAHAEGGYEVELTPWLYRLPGLLSDRAGELVTERSVAQLRDLFT